MAGSPAFPASAWHLSLPRAPPLSSSTEFLQQLCNLNDILQSLIIYSHIHLGLLCMREISSQHHKFLGIKNEILEFSFLITSPVKNTRINRQRRKKKKNTLKSDSCILCPFIISSGQSNQLRVHQQYLPVVKFCLTVNIFLIRFSPGVSRRGRLAFGSVSNHSRRKKILETGRTSKQFSVWLWSWMKH